MSAREEVLGKIGKAGEKLFSTTSSMRQELEALSLAKLEKLAARLRLVTRAEFEEVQEMIKAARREQLALAKRIETLEGGAARKSPAKKMTSKRGAKSTAKSSRN